VVAPFGAALLSPLNPKYLVGHQTGACSEALLSPFNRTWLRYAFGAMRS